MRIQLAVILFLASATITKGQVTTTLEGCQKPSELGRALAKLQSTGWDNISIGVLKKLWPTNINGLDCSNGVCTSLVSNDRVIRNRCDCCETFFFDKAADNLSQPDHLQNLVVHYSAMNKKQVISAAQAFARAMGMPVADARTLGAKEHEEYRWDDTNSKHLYGLEVELSHSGEIWTIRLNLGRHAN